MGLSKLGNNVLGGLVGDSWVCFEGQRAQNEKHCGHEFV
jgi:hypothetical protein